VTFVNLRRRAGARRQSALADWPRMSAGVRARELAFVNGDRDISARFVIVERSEQTSC